MNLLLDTHIWIWSKVDPKRLGKRAAAELSDTGNELWLSPATAKVLKLTLFTADQTLLGLGDIATLANR